jgi:hypothetical protein
MNTPRPIRIALAGLGAAALAAGLVLPASPASAWVPNIATVTARASTDGHGGQTDGTFRPVLSSTGRYLAFNDQKTSQVWVEDLITGRSEQVSVNPAGAPANTWANPAGISADGNRILFLSNASNLGGTPSSAENAYVRDRTANTTIRVNIASNGSTAAVYDHQASLSDAGTEVAWTADSPDHVFFRSLTTFTTQQVDVSSSEVSGTDTPLDSRITADGKHVVFSSYSPNLVANDTNPKSDVFVRDVVAGTTIKATYGSGGSQPDRAMSKGSGSADGRYVAFEAPGKDLTANDTSGNSDVFVRDTVANTTTLVSLAGTSTPLNHHATRPLISGDGKHVLFQSEATNIVGNDQVGSNNLFRRDLVTQSTVVIDQATIQTLGNGDVGWQMGISTDGSVAAYTSGSTNLVTGDTNAKDDVFVQLPEPMGPHGELSQLAFTGLQRFTGSTAGTSAATADLINGRVFTGRFLADLAKAPAFAQHREPVTRLYFAFFERQPDRNGLNYWVGKRKNGTNLNTIATKFAQSSEFKTKYGNVGNQGFVTLVYQNVLDRNPDQAGLAHWVAKMAGGMTRGQVMVQFSEASEGKRHLAPSVDSTLIGLGMLGKMASPSDFTAARAAWDAVGGPEGAARSFLTSTAYMTSLQ